MVSLKHKFISGKAPGANSSEVRPNNWNDEHDLKTVSANVYLGQDNSGGGLVKEMPILITGIDDTGAMYSAAAVDAAIAAAFAAYHPFVTGDVIATIGNTRTGGWVLCNGQTLQITNGEANHALFLMLWAFAVPGGGMWPVSPGRGASAEADWLAGKLVPVPDASGCVLGMIDPSDAINSLINLPGVKVGVEKLFLTVPQMPAHEHTLYDPANMLTRNNLGGVGSGPSVTFDGVSDKKTGATGGDPDAVPAFSAPLPINLTQPTMGVNFFIKL